VGSTDIASCFGLRNAGAEWSRFIDGALSDLRWNIALVYADDTLVYTKELSVMFHIQHLDQVFSRLRSHAIIIKGSKVKLGVKELSFLGQIISKTGYRPDPKKIKAVADLLPPTNVHQLRRVLGLFAYYRKYIPKFAEIASSLYKLTGKNVQNKRDSQRRIVMNAEQRLAFETLKLRLTTEPIFLDFPRWDCPFEVHCDGSKKGIAAVLTQIVEKQERVLMYASKSLTPSELSFRTSLSVKYLAALRGLFFLLDVWVVCAFKSLSVPFWILLTVLVFVSCSFSPCRKIKELPRLKPPPLRLELAAVDVRALPVRVALPA
jgi:hypothetical protein